MSWRPCHGWETGTCFTHIAGQDNCKMVDYFPTGGNRRSRIVNRIGRRFVPIFKALEWKGQAERKRVKTLTLYVACSAQGLSTRTRGAVG